MLQKHRLKEQNQKTHVTMELKVLRRIIGKKHKLKQQNQKTHETIELKVLRRRMGKKRYTIGKE